MLPLETSERHPEARERAQIPRKFAGGSIIRTPCAESGFPWPALVASLAYVLSRHGEWDNLWMVSTQHNYHYQTVGLIPDWSRHFVLRRLVHPPV